MQNSSKKPKSDILKLAVTLCLITGITAALIALVNSVTAPIISGRGEDKSSQSLKAVLPEADSFEKYDFPDAVVMSADGQEIAIDNVWKAKKGKEPIGVCVKVSPNGYGGAIETIVGINISGEIEGTEIVSLAETSGIGTKIQEESFLAQFIGKSKNITGVETVPGKDEVQTISGATKSSKAFLRGVNAALTVAQKVMGGDSQ